MMLLIYFPSGDFTFLKYLILETFRPFLMVDMSSSLCHHQFKVDRPSLLEWEEPGMLLT